MNKHPLSAAIVREAKKEHAEIQPVADFTALPGEGVTGRIGTGRASLLNLAALDKRGLSSDEVADAFNRASENGMSSVALADTFGVLAVFVMADEIKADMLTCFLKPNLHAFVSFRDKVLRRWSATASTTLRRSHKPTSALPWAFAGPTARLKLLILP